MKEINNQEDYQAIINSDKPVLLDFYADWCGPCKSLLPVVEKLSAKYEDKVIIAKVNVDTNAELASEFRVRSIPALFLIDKGVVKEQMIGLQSEAFLDAKIEGYTKELAK